MSMEAARAAGATMAAYAPSAALLQRVLRPSFHKFFMQAEDTIKFFENGQTLGWSGFAPAGYPKAVPIALANHVEKNNLQGKMRFNLMVGASVGAETADRWAKLKMLSRIWPYQSGKAIADGINAGEIHFKDIHLSNFANSVAYGHFKTAIDIAVIEATEILPDGGVVPGAAGGITQEVVDVADKIIIEVNTSMPSFRKMHDMCKDLRPPARQPLLINRVDDRIGESVVRFDPEKVIAVVESQYPDNGNELKDPGPTEIRIAEHIIEFLEREVQYGRMPANLLPLQSGVGNIANAVIAQLAASQFQNVDVWTEVLQDTMLDWFETGKLRHASTAALALSKPAFQRLYKDFSFYEDKIILRPQGISNHPELIRRLGVIAMNTPLEVDIYGHANSTHVLGSKMVHGIGGSGDFLRNAYLSIVHFPSARSTPTDPTGISAIVPFVSHVDHTEHDLFIICTEQGLADVRAMDPRVRARFIIQKCAHPDYKDQLLDYLEHAERQCAKTKSLHEPHMLAVAFKMYQNLTEKGSMKVDNWVS